MTLIASSPTRDRLLDMARKFYYSPNVALNDDGTVSNSKGIISGVCWKQKKNRFRLELINN